jgi:hypothetical protein
VSNRSRSAIGPVSVHGANSFREKVRRGQRLGWDFSAKVAYFGSTETTPPLSPSAKPRRLKDNSADGRKPFFRRTAWWGWWDSNRQPTDYGPEGDRIDDRRLTIARTIGWQECRPGCAAELEGTAAARKPDGCPMAVSPRARVRGSKRSVDASLGGAGRGKSHQRTAMAHGGQFAFR